MKTILLVTSGVILAITQLLAQTTDHKEFLNTKFWGNPNNYYKIISGQPDAVKSEKSFKIQFSYDNMVVEKKLTEEQYIRKNMDAHNKREPGSGQKWLESWNFNKTEKNAPAFTDELNAQTSKRDVYFVPGNNDAKYTMIVHTKYLYPRGYKKTELQLEILIVDSMDPQKVILKLNGTKIKTDAPGFEYGSSASMKEAYSITGGYLGKFLVKHFYPNK